MPIIACSAPMTAMPPCPALMPPVRWAKQAGQRKKGGTTKHGYSADDDFVCDDSEDEVESSSDSSDGGSSGEDSDGGGRGRQGQAQRRPGGKGKGAKGGAEAGRGGAGGGQRQQQQQQPGEEEEAKWLEQAKASLFEQNLLQVGGAIRGVAFRGLAVSHFPLPLPGQRLELGDIDIGVHSTSLPADLCRAGDRAQGCGRLVQVAVRAVAAARADGARPPHAHLLAVARHAGHPGGAHYGGWATWPQGVCVLVHLWHVSVCANIPNNCCNPLHRHHFQPVPVTAVSCLPTSLPRWRRAWRSAAHHSHMTTC